MNEVASKFIEGKDLANESIHDECGTKYHDEVENEEGREDPIVSTVIRKVKPILHWRALLDAMPSRPRLTLDAIKPEISYRRHSH